MVKRKSQAPEQHTQQGVLPRLIASLVDRQCQVKKLMKVTPERIIQVIITMHYFQMFD